VVREHEGHRSLECDVRRICTASHAVGMEESVGQTQVATILPQLGCCLRLHVGAIRTWLPQRKEGFPTGNAFDGEPWKPAPCKKHHGCSLRLGDAGFRLIPGLKSEEAQPSGG
jgi:hypothetical protein